VAVNLGVAGQTKIFAGGAVAYAALGVEALGLEIRTVPRLAGQRLEVLVGVAHVRRLGSILVQCGGKLVSLDALVGGAGDTGAHEVGAARVGVIPAVTGHPARAQGAHFGGAVAMPGQAMS
jgi:hypothetical protein